jgi:hypothetical protein
MLSAGLTLGYTQVYESDCGGWVWQHSLHLPDEILQNLNAYKILADKGYKMEMLPYLVANAKEEREKWIPDVHGTKNPDIRIDGNKIGDIKTPALPVVNQKCINRLICSAAKQKVQVAVINLSDRDYTIRDIKKGIVGSLQPHINKSIEETWIITRTQNLFIVKREIVFNDVIYDALKSL